MFQYALKEYLEILIDADKNNSIRLSKEEIRFYNAFGKVLNGKITDDDRSVVFEYVNQKYSDEINAFREPNLNHLMNYLE